jgi:hypothetical protein
LPEDGATILCCAYLVEVQYALGALWSEGIGEPPYVVGHDAHCSAALEYPFGNGVYAARFVHVQTFKNPIIFELLNA